VPTFLGLALGLLGLLAIAAGVQNRGAELMVTVIGGGGGKSAPTYGPGNLGPIGKAVQGAIPNHPLTSSPAPRVVSGI
jgi:hypothetical protein